MISLQNVDREHAFGESRSAAAGDAGRQPQRGARERAAGARDAAAERRAGADQQRAGRRSRASSSRRRSTTPSATGSRRSSTRRSSRHRHSTRRRGSSHFPYIIERGERLQDEPMPPAGFSQHVLETREPLLIVENLDRRGRAVREPDVCAASRRSRFSSSRSSSGGKATGVISLQNVDREHAFAQSDQQLLETLAGSLSVALENARLVHETRQRNAELALINGVQDAIAGELDHAGDLRRRRRQDPGDLRRAGRAIIDARRGDRARALPVHHRARRAAAGGADRAERLHEARARDARVAADQRGRRGRG